MSATAPPGQPHEPVAANETAAALVRLGAVVVAGVAAAILFHGVAVLVVVLAIVAMIMLHEFGHFVAAKASGMKVTEFFLGFGPRLWSVRRGETEYGVKAIPAGGYVKIVGMTMLEEVDPGDEERSYRQASFPRRMAVAVAGSTVHMIIALGLCYAILVGFGAAVPTRPYVDGLLRFAHGRTPAQLAGLRNGDLFVSIGGRAVTGYTVLEQEIGSHAGKALDAVVRRDGHLVHLVLHPVDDQRVVEYAGSERIVPASKKATGIIGVELSSGRNESVGPLAAVGRSFGEFGSLVAATWHGLAAVFSFQGLSEFAHSVVTAGRHTTSSGSTGGGGGGGGGSSGQTQLLSILGVVEIGSQAASQNLAELLLLLAAVNVFVGLANLFPMLPLDGGHVLIACYERIRSRRGRPYHADVLKLMPVAYLFLTFIIVMGLGALYANIVQPAHLPGG